MLLTCFGKSWYLLTVSSHKLQSSIGSNCPKSPTKIMDTLPKVKLRGVIAASLKQRRFACCKRMCMRPKKARPMKDISSTMSRTTLFHCSSSRRRASSLSSFFHGAFGKTQNVEQAVLAPKPILNAATPVYAVSSTVASMFSRWNKKRTCCTTVFNVVDFPLPAEPPNHERKTRFKESARGTSMLVHSNDVGSPFEDTVSENTLCRIELVQGVISEYSFFVEESWRSVRVRLSPYLSFCFTSVQSRRRSISRPVVGDTARPSLAVSQPL